MKYQFFVCFFNISLFALALNTSFAQANNQPFIEFYDPDASVIIDQNARLTVLGEGYGWSEGPLWVSEGEYLLFSDVPNNILYKYSKDDGVTEYLTPSGATAIDANDSSQGGNGLLLNVQNQLVIMQHGDRRVAIMDAPLSQPKAVFKSLAAVYQGNRLNSPNDGVFHSNGDLYFTDPPYGLKGGRNSPHKAIDFDGIYRLSPNGNLSVQDSSIEYPNGIIFSNDESFAIVAASDRADAKWYKFDVGSNGNLSNKQVFYDVSSLVGKEGEQGLPDGLALHSAGYLFATGPGGVFIFTEAGKLLAKIRTGKATANCALSADEKTLYMTAHDVLMSVQLK